MNRKIYIAIIGISIIVMMSVIGCSSNTVKMDDPDKVDDTNHVAESLAEDEPSEIDVANIEHEDENNINISNNEDKTTEDISTKGEKIELSSEEQKEINTFLSNFTEISFKDFEGKPSNDRLISFGILHNYINNMDAFKIKDNYYGFLDKAIVERSIKRFFGLNVEHQKTDGYDFDGNDYIMLMASGGAFPMAVVQEMYSNNGSYTVYFNEIFTNELSDYSITPQKLQEEIKNNPDLIWLGSSKKAIVERHDFEGNSRYKLIEYITISD